MATISSMGLRAVALLCISLVSAACSGGEEEPTRPASSCVERATIFLDAGINRARQKRTMQILGDVADVDSSTFHSPTEELKAFKRQYRARPQFFRGLGPEDFPGRIEVTLDPRATVERFETQIQGTTGIDEVIERPCLSSPTRT